MSDSTSRRWHATNAGGENPPSVWRFTMKQALAMGTSLGGGFVVFAVVSELGWGVLASVCAAGFIPSVTLAILLAFVCGHPPGHLMRWIEWQVIRSTARSLLEQQQNTKNEHEN